MQLTGAERYLPDKLPQLEKYVDEQVRTGEYDLECNMALLRHYQFQPAIAKVDIIAKVLIKAMMQLPKPDFHLAVCMLNQRLAAEEPLATIIKLASHLESSRYQDFWMLTASARDLLASVPGFYDCIRQYMVQVLTITFQKLPKRYLGECLKLEGASLDKLVDEHIKSKGWTPVKGAAGDFLVVPRNDQNRPAAKQTQEAIDFSHVAGVLRTVTLGL